MKETILVTQSSMPDLDEYMEEIKCIWDSHWLTNMGTKHNELMNRLKEYLGVPEISLFCNGHIALELTIQAMDFPAGSEVITTPFTFASTTHAIVRNNLIPIFGDIRDDDYTLDPEKIECLITDRTVAIIPVHVYGHICEVEKIEAIAKKHNLKVIYDAAHAFGEKYKGVGVGNYGDASMFSFHATKVFNTIEGGGVCFKNPVLGKRLYQLKNFGIQDEETVDAVGANGKMNEFAAAFGICNLRHIDGEIEKRKRVSERYQQQLSDIAGLKLPWRNSDIQYNYAYFPVVISKEPYGISRDDLYDKLKQEGIYTRKYFYPLTSRMDCYRELPSKNEVPIAEKIAQSVLTLPIYADLSLEQVDNICKLIREMPRR